MKRMNKWQKMWRNVSGHWQGKVGCWRRVDVNGWANYGGYANAPFWKNGQPRRAGMPWNQKEKDDLVAGFRNYMTPSQLARLHERTLGGIEARLARELEARQDMTASASAR